MDAVELALRFMNYDVLCIALHCIEMRCSWPSFVYFILFWVWFIFFLAAVIRASFFFSCCFSSDFTALKSPRALQCTLHIRYPDVYFCIMSINVFSFSLFQGIFGMYADGILLISSLCLAFQLLGIVGVAVTKSNEWANSKKICANTHTHYTYAHALTHAWTCTDGKLASPLNEWEFFFCSVKWTHSFAHLLLCYVWHECVCMYTGRTSTSAAEKRE